MKYCCDRLKDVTQKDIIHNFSGQWSWTYSEWVGEFKFAWDISYCPFCGTKLSDVGENK